ncbi:MAG TPA: amidase family protein, partial [Nitrososphaeraceae archaeon]|nr:amidase family protein [Nitrososphaeraceae archaeon]
MPNLLRLNAQQVSQGIKNGYFSAQEYISQILERIQKVDDKINAFITVDNDGALRQASLIDKKVRRGEKIGTLAGVAVSIKDNICTQGLKTTCASKLLKEYVPPYDATV